MKTRLGWLCSLLIMIPAISGCLLVVGKDLPFEEGECEAIEEFYEIDDIRSAPSTSPGRNRDRIVLSTGDSIGPFSEAILSGPFFFASGKIPRDPDTGAVVQHDVRNGTRYVLEEFGRTLERAGLSYSDVVKVTIYLKDMSQWDEMNAVYAEFFPVDPPVRSTVEVSGLARDAVLEIDIIAIRR